MQISYDDLTKRNLGIFTKFEQKKLKQSTVAIAGVGGVGGLAVERLARLGIGHLKIADPENFDPTNLNRQYASNSKNIGKNKAKEVGKSIKDINPSVKIDIYNKGISHENLKDFLKKADIIIDGLDISVPVDLRIALHKLAQKNNLYIVTANAIGFGSTLQVFSPKGLSLEQFIGSDKKTHFMPVEKMCPMPPDYVPQDTAKKIISGTQEYMPTISVGCAVASSLMVTEVVNILLKKKKPIVVPKVVAVDLLSKKIQVFDFKEKK